MRKTPSFMPGVSMDQLAAKELGAHTQLASLELGLEGADFAGSCDNGFSCAYSYTISWRSATTPLPMEHNPRAVFERLLVTLEARTSRPGSPGCGSSAAFSTR